MSVKPVPDGYPTVSPYLVVHNVAGLVQFLQGVFGAHELKRMLGPDGSMTHAEVRIGSSVVMMGEASQGFEPMPGMLHVYLPDADAAYQRGLAAGATSLRPPENQFYGDRIGGFRDPYGNQWWVATHIEDVSEEELRRRIQSQPRT